MSRERGVLFNKDMVKACLTCSKCGKLSRDFPCCHCGSTEFLKSQTRRILNPQPTMDSDTVYTPDLYNNNPNAWAFWSGCKMNEARTWKPKLGTAGDFLYVRETARLTSIITPVSMYDNPNRKPLHNFRYEADGKYAKNIILPERIKPIGLKKCCSNGAFKELASIWFKITGVRVERVSCISEGDALKDGGWTYANCPIHKSPFSSFRQIWYSVYPGSWERNDWVFVYDIERCGSPE